MSRVTDLSTDALLEPVMHFAGHRAALDRTSTGGGRAQPEVHGAAVLSPISALTAGDRFATRERTYHKVHNRL